MQRIVIDLEWNQPLAGRTHAKGLYGEIIQIGAAKINEQFNVMDTFSEIIKPLIFFANKAKRDGIQLGTISFHAKCSDFKALRTFSYALGVSKSVSVGLLMNIETGLNVAIYSVTVCVNLHTFTQGKKARVNFACKQWGV